MKFTFIIILWSSLGHSQFINNDDDLRDYFSSVLLLSDQGLKTIQIQGEQFEVLYRKPWTDEIIENKTLQMGTGFLLSRGIDVYLVTAEHVARILKPTSQVKYKGVDGKKKEIEIQEFSSNKSYLAKLNWVRHPKADIAILHLGTFDDIIKDFVPFDYEFISETLVAPNRFNNLTIIGFPLGLGVTPTDISPITRSTRTASDIVYFRRFDNGIVNPFIILDDPSIGGFSGGPVLEIRRTPINSPKVGGQVAKIAPTLVGLVHGTIAQNEGGFAAIVPGSQILETLQSAPKYNGEYTFYYPDGSLWSKRIYKDGLPWTVLSNFNRKGEPQEKGDLNEGEGTLYVWNEKSTFYEVIRCTKGKCSGGVYGFPKKK